MLAPEKLQKVVMTEPVDEEMRVVCQDFEIFFEEPKGLPPKELMTIRFP